MAAPMGTIEPELMRGGCIIAPHARAQLVGDVVASNQDWSGAVG